MLIPSYLPPGFLLPAWSQSQLSQLSSRFLRKSTQCRISTFPARADAAVEVPKQLFHHDNRRYVRANGVQSGGPPEDKQSRRFREHISAVREEIKKQEKLSRQSSSTSAQEQAVVAKYKKQHRKFRHDRIRDSFPGARRIAVVSARQRPRSARDSRRYKNIHLDLTGDNVDNTAKGKDTPVPSKTLLEELFPLEAAKLRKLEEEVKAKRHKIPELPLPELPSQALPAWKIATGSAGEVIPRRVINHISTEDHHNIILLILDNALPDLVEADFHRVPPKGKYIAEWRAMYTPLAIIPARSGPTAQCTGTYYLAFDTIEQAVTWRNRLELIHLIVEKHRSQSFDSLVAPRRGFLSEGEDVGELLAEFSIFAYGTTPRIRIHKVADGETRMKEEMREVMARLQPDATKSFRPGRSVLLWIDGYTMGTKQEIIKMIRVDGAERHMLWESRPDEILVAAFDESIMKHGHQSYDEDITNVRQPKRWLITLRDEAEARRFMRVWHKRTLPNWAEIQPENDGEPWPIIRTEVLW